MDLQTLSDVVFYLMFALCLAVAAYRDSHHGDHARAGARRVHSTDSIGRATPDKDRRSGLPVSLVVVSIVFGAPLFLLLLNGSGVPASRRAIRTPSVAGEDAGVRAPGPGVPAALNYCPPNYADPGAGEDGRSMPRENR